MTAIVYERALDIVKANRQRRIDGSVNAIPFSFQKFGDIIPGMQRKNMTIVSAASGLGKSKFTKLLYVIEPFEYVRTHPQAGIKLDLFYFALEESKENFIHSIMVYKLFKDHGLIVPIKKLKSITRGEIIDEDVIEKLEGMREWFIEFESTVRIIDYIRNPTGIVKFVEEYLDKVGHWTYREHTFHHPEKGEVTKRFRDKFHYDHPQHYVGVIIDHIGLLQPEKGLTLHQTISRMSSDYGIALRDRYECSVIFVQQQSAATEEKQYSYKGSLVEAKLEPSLQTLGDNKLVGRDADEIIALFAPDRYDIVNHRGYDILKFQDHYRSLQILKSRDGESNIRIGLFFDGRVNVFEELPRAKDMTDEDYEYYANRVNRTLTPLPQGTINFS